MLDRLIFMHLNLSMKNLEFLYQMDATCIREKMKLSIFYL